MGIRPKMTLLVGLDDFDFDAEKWEIKDTRFKGDRNHDLLDMKCKLPVYNSDLYNPDFAKNLSIRNMLQIAAGAKRSDDIIEVDKLLHFSPEYGNPNVIGMKIGEEIGGKHEWIIYALTVMFPQFDLSNSPGYHTFQSRTIDETDNSNLWKQAYMRLQSDDYPDTEHDIRLAKMLQELVDTNMNNGVNSLNGPSWGYAAHYLFNTGLSMNVRQDEIKLILSWQWS